MEIMVHLQIGLLLGIALAVGLLLAICSQSRATPDRGTMDDHLAAW